MASCAAVNSVPPERPAPHAPLTAPWGFGGGGGLVALAPLVGTLDVMQRLLGQCRGARAGAWLARGVALWFAFAAVFTRRPLPEVLDVVARLGLGSLSWCAGLAALSAAGPAFREQLWAARGLFSRRGITFERLGALQPLALALWVLRHIGVLALVLLLLCAGLTSEPARAARLAALAGGGVVYVLALAAGVGVLAHLCHVLGRTRGKALLAALVIVPELLGRAWPELPRVPSAFARLLDACLGLGGGA